MDPGRWWNRHVALPVLDLRRGTRSLALYREALRNERRPLQELRREQFARLRALLDHAFRNVPHYHDVFRERGLRPEDIRDFDDLRKLPYLTKEAIQGAPERLRSADFARRRPAPARTGGSTGQPLQYFLDRESLGWSFALMWRGFGYAGYRLGDRRATLAGLSVVGGGPAMRRWLQTRVFERNLALPAMRLDPSLVESYVRKLRSFRPRFLVGYPSALATFGALAGPGLASLGVRAIFTTAEMLYPDERARIEASFAAKVHDWYGANDGGVSAFECRQHPGYHVDVERAFVEVIREGEPAAPGEPGEVIATDLHSFAMPFLRYAVGDVAVPSADVGTCGRTLPLWDRIEGRTTDYLRFPNGVVLSGPAMTLVFKDLALDDYLVEQVAADRLRVQVVTRPGGHSAEDVRRALARQCGPGVAVEVEAVPSIPREGGAKRRFIVSRSSVALR